MEFVLSELEKARGSLVQNSVNSVRTTSCLNRK